MSTVAQSRRRRCCVACLALAHWACAAPIRGGQAAASEAALPGEIIAVFDPRPCSDASGGSMDWRSRLYLVRRADGTRVLVEARTEYDSLVYASSFDDGEARVFQIAVRSRGQSPRLHEVRLPLSGAKGTFRVAELARARGRGSRFRGSAGEVAVRCQLSPVSMSESVDKASRASKLPPS